MTNDQTSSRSNARYFRTFWVIGLALLFVGVAATQVTKLAPSVFYYSTLTGVTGADGVTGSTGSTGATGWPGSTGVSGTSGATGVSGVTIPWNLGGITGSQTNYLLIGISNEGLSTVQPDNGQTVTSITWNGTAALKHCSASHSGGTFTNSTDAEIWYLQNPTAVASNLVITLTGNAVLQVGATVFGGVGSVGTCAADTEHAGGATSESFAVGTGSGGAIFDTVAVKSTGTPMTITPSSTPTGLKQLTLGANNGYAFGWNCSPSDKCSTGGATSYFLGSLTSETTTFPTNSNAAYAATALNPKPTMPPAIY